MKDLMVCIFFILITGLFMTGNARNSDTTTIHRVVPDISLCTSGRLVTIEGENLPSESFVYVGDHLIHSGENKSNRQIRARIPKDVPYGTYELKVVSAGKRDIPTKPITLVASETAPIIEKVTPTVVHRKDVLTSRGVTVTLTGQNFDSDVKASLGWSNHLTVLASSATQITAIIAGTVPAGKWDLNIVNKNGERGSLRNAITLQ